MFFVSLGIFYGNKIIPHKVTIVIVVLILLLIILKVIIIIIPDFHNNRYKYVIPTYLSLSLDIIITISGVYYCNRRINNTYILQQ